MNNIIERLWNQNKMVRIEDLRGYLFQDESAGHTFKIYGIDDAGNSVPLSGTPSGNFLRPDMTDVALDCSVSDGVVYATLPANCYSLPGRGGITVFITADGQTTAIYAAVVTVSRTESGNVAPPATQNVVDLINAIAAAVETIPASYSDLMADIAPTYSDSSIYAVGQYAWYNGDLKRCIVPITTGESYTAAHWESAVMGQDITDIKCSLNTANNVLQNNNVTDIEWFKRKDVGVRYGNGEDVSSSVYSSTNYIDIRDFVEITYKRHKSTSSSVNTGIAFYQSDFTYISGVSGISSASEAGVEDNTVSVPSNAAYVRCTIFRNQATGAFSICGKSKLRKDISRIVSDVENISDLHEVTFMTSVDAYTSTGITFTLTENGLEISGTSSVNSNSYYVGLNGYKEVINTSTNFGKIIEPGLYKAKLSIIQGSPSKSIGLAVSSTSATGQDRQDVLDGEYFSITEKSGIAIKIPGNTAFGSSESPTIIDFGVYAVYAKDDYARTIAENESHYFGFFYPEGMQYENGSIDTSDGTNTSSMSNRLRTDYCRFENGFRITIPDDWMYGYCMYSSAAASGYIQFIGWNIDSYETRKLVESAEYVRFVLKKRDDSAISPTDAAGIVVEKFVMADDVTPVVRDLEIEQGSMNTSGGDSNTNYDKRLRTGFIPVDPVYGFKMVVPSGWLVNYFLYSSNTVSSFFYESKTNSDDYTMHYDGASNAKYVRFWMRKEDDSAITPADANGFICTFYFRGGAGGSDSNILYPNGVDQTAKIEELLNDGRCVLGPGTFYTTGITMPAGSILSGSGNSTRLILTGTSDGSCITMNKKCTVKNIEIIGSVDEIEYISTIGNRNGIQCVGGSSDNHWRCIISECIIHGFTGAGILMHNMGTAQAAKVSNCFLIENCVGLYIKDDCDYVHVHGCTMSKNYYGCINNGANNMFSCDTFTTNYYGLMMGDTSGTSYGAAGKSETSASNFGHNTIRSIYINNISGSGIGFTGCYISESGAEIINSGVVNFAGCSMTNTFSLVVDSSGLVMFTGTSFNNNFNVESGNVSVTSPHKVKFNSCYYVNGNACDPVS